MTQVEMRKIRQWYEVRAGEQVHGPFASMAEVADFVAGTHPLIGDVEIFQWRGLVLSSRKINGKDYRALLNNPKTLVDPYDGKLLNEGDALTAEEWAERDRVMGEWLRGSCSR
jgi:hypothetical protein